MTWSLERIYANCVDNEDGCMLWKGGMSKGYPICQEPAPELSYGQRQVHVRRKVWELAKGSPAPAGPKYVLVVSCSNRRCVADGCLELMTKAKRLRQAAAAGAFSSVAYRAKVAAGRRRGSKVSDADVAGVVGSEEKLQAIAARLGISMGYASALRRGEARRDYSSPFAALQSVPTRRQQ